MVCAAGDDKLGVALKKLPEKELQGLASNEDNFNFQVCSLYYVLICNLVHLKSHVSDVVKKTIVYKYTISGDQGEEYYLDCSCMKNR